MSKFNLFKGVGQVMSHLPANLFDTDNTVEEVRSWYGLTREREMTKPNLKNSKFVCYLQ